MRFSRYNINKIENDKQTQKQSTIEQKRLFWIVNKPILNGFQRNIRKKRLKGIQQQKQTFQNYCADLNCS
jgi:hypothetical protein